MSNSSIIIMLYYYRQYSLHVEINIDHLLIKKQCDRIILIVKTTAQGVIFEYIIILLLSFAHCRSLGRSLMINTCLLLCLLCCCQVHVANPRGFWLVFHTLHNMSSGFVMEKS